ncbi:MAG: GntR family transcriptional regulator [Halanaerobiales bacterium]|nr:GntR family transcriptional regulator [Halanaerobiales bacterium]
MSEIDRLDKESVIPFYHQIKTKLKEKIRTQEYEAGDILPSENELSEMYYVSRNTVRRALKDMVNDGLIKSIKGKGYYIKEAKLEQNFFRFYTFTDDYSLKNNNVISKLIYRDVEEAKDHIANKLKISQNSKVHKIVKKREIKDKPIILETSYVSADRYDLSTFCDNKYEYGCIYDIIRDNYNIQIGNGEEYIEPVNLKKFEAKQLNAKIGEPAFLVESIVYAIDNQPLELKRSIIRGDRFEFKLHYNFHI